MRRTFRRTVQIGPGGRIELEVPELPSGEDADVVVFLHGKAGDGTSCLGLFVDDPELLDEVVADAMELREIPFRVTRD